MNRSHLRTRDQPRKGKATEHLIAAIAVLASGGELNALTALVDDEGVDLTLKRRNGSRTLDVQVKARFSDEEGSRLLRDDGTFVADVRRETFRPREDLYVLYAAVDAKRAEIDWVWLVPSSVLAKDGFEVKPGGRTLLRFQASAKSKTSDKWSNFRLQRHEFPAQLLKILIGLEPDVLDEDFADDAESND